MTEPIAKDKYSQITSGVMIDVGLVIKRSQPWLCASPDSLVKIGEDLIVLEIKCPSSCREKEIKVPYLKNGELVKSDKYYTQVQLQLYCCNLKKAHFFVYSSADYVLLEIEKDQEFL